MLQKTTLDFLKSLKKNNNRDWFEKNRAKYETAKKDFDEFVQKLIDVYIKERIDEERFIDTVRRLGPAPFKAHVYAKVENANDATAKANAAIESVAV